MDFNHLKSLKTIKKNDMHIIYVFILGKISSLKICILNYRNMLRRSHLKLNKNGKKLHMHFMSIVTNKRLKGTYFYGSTVNLV